MKNILSILLVSVLLFGCSKEDEIQPSTLDSDLYGNWSDYESSTYYEMTLSPNGLFVYQTRSSNTSVWNGNSGIWWTEGDHLVLSGDNWAVSESYSLSGNSLDYYGQSWSK